MFASIFLTNQAFFCIFYLNNPTIINTLEGQYEVKAFGRQGHGEAGKKRGEDCGGHYYP
jgi:hypothetical protein